MVELDGIDDGTGVAPAPPGVGTSSGAARREDGLNAGREGNVNLNEEFMDDVDDTTDVSGVPERSGASDDPAVVADERFTTKPLDEDRAARSKPGNEPAVKAP